MAGVEENQELVRVSKQMCMKCAYGYRFNGNVSVYCDYLGMTSHSRIFENGEKKYKGNKYCDKYSPTEKKVDGRKKWTLNHMKNNKVKEQKNE